MTLKVLFFGDIIGRIGREGLKKIMPKLKKKYQPDLVLANGENLAHGIGLTEKTANEMMDAGVDFFTTGNHFLKKEDIRAMLEAPDPKVIRPANYPPGVAGRGEKLLEIGLKKVLVVNLVGRVFMGEDFDCPFRKFDEIFQKYKKEEAVVIVDFHAEATSEKMALGHYLDGRAQAVLGTHTHVATADERILPAGTAYISDVGMVGAADSVIGDRKEEVIKAFLTQLPFRMEIPEEGEVLINAVYLEIDCKTKKSKKIERIRETVSV
ncbi:MAG: TIGR00282 family metallophosphoesterase [Patescibacteria group bacterium]